MGRGRAVSTDAVGGEQRRRNTHLRFAENKNVAYVRGRNDRKHKRRFVTGFARVPLRDASKAPGVGMWDGSRSARKGHPRARKRPEVVECALMKRAEGNSNNDKTLTNLSGPETRTKRAEAKRRRAALRGVGAARLQ